MKIEKFSDMQILENILPIYFLSKLEMSWALFEKTFFFFYD